MQQLSVSKPFCFLLFVIITEVGISVIFGLILVHLPFFDSISLNLFVLFRIKPQHAHNFLLTCTKIHLVCQNMNVKC